MPAHSGPAPNNPRPRKRPKISLRTPPTPYGTRHNNPRPSAMEAEDFAPRLHRPTQHRTVHNNPRPSAMEAEDFTPPRTYTTPNSTQQPTASETRPKISLHTMPVQHSAPRPSAQQPTASKEAEDFPPAPSLHCTARRYTTQDKTTHGLGNEAEDFRNYETLANA